MHELSEWLFVVTAIINLIESIMRRYRKDPDQAGSERSFIICLLCILLADSSKAQPTRPWVLTVDSNVVAPYEDIVKATAYRMEVDSLADSYFEESRELDKAKEALQRSLADCMKSANGKQETIELYKHDLDKSQKEAAKFQGQAKSSKRWAWTFAVLFLGSLTLHIAR